MKSETSRKLRLVVAYTSLAVVLALAVAWAVSTQFNEDGRAAQDPARAPVDTAKEVTVMLHASGVDFDVTYTCVKDDAVSMCESPVNGVWSHRLVVPAGTVVTIQPQGGVVPGACSIADESDRVTLVPYDRGGVCEWVAK